MKGLKLGLAIMAAAVLTIGLSGMAYAFHEGGVAQCEGCHTMHNSVGNATVIKNGTPLQGVASLLKGSDQSSTCLLCHGNTAAKAGSYRVFTTDAAKGSTPPANYTPGGDFAWVTITFDAASDMHTSQVKGERHGHNVIAADFAGLALGDTTLLTAPGGTYSASNLTCISCHDPHPAARLDANGTISYRGTGPIIGPGSYGDETPTGTDKVGVYRILGGNGYVPKSYAGGPAFTNDPPVAVAPRTYNVATTGENSGDIRVAYGKGMSEWCSNCHVNIHADDVSSHFIHPASNLAKLNGGTVNIATNYNQYVKSGDLTGGSGVSYASLVPFEEGTTDIATLKSHVNTAGAGTGSTQGPVTGNENVMCLSCHRAHASGFNHMTRWDNDFEFITENGAYPVSTTTTSLYNEVDYKAAMYGRDPTASIFATYQRSLCNKCHVKD
jgi:predicted CXXCH cytochrome family protein